MKLAPQNIQLIGNELAVVWNDGKETYLPLERLRMLCPCAACGGEPDVMGRVERPEVHHTPESFRLLEWRMIGGYAIQPSWADGHGSGIYSFDYLRRIAEPEK